MSGMKRREFIALVAAGGLLLAAKVKRARGQQPAMPVIGFLGGATLFQPGSIGPPLSCSSCANSVGSRVEPAFVWPPSLCSRK
jgi:hypothetical protein